MESPLFPPSPSTASLPTAAHAAGRMNQRFAPPASGRLFHERQKHCQNRGRRHDGDGAVLLHAAFGRRTGVCWPLFMADLGRLGFASRFFHLFRPHGIRIMAAEIQLTSTITCPKCGHREVETMPTDACQFFYDCKGCGTVLKPHQGDCCALALKARIGGNDDGQNGHNVKNSSRNDTVS